MLCYTEWRCEALTLAWHLSSSEQCCGRLPQAQAAWMSLVFLGMFPCSPRTPCRNGLHLMSSESPVGGDGSHGSPLWWSVRCWAGLSPFGLCWGFFPTALGLWSQGRRPRSWALGFGWMVGLLDQQGRGRNPACPGLGHPAAATQRAQSPPLPA